MAVEVGKQCTADIALSPFQSQVPHIEPAFPETQSGGRGFEPYPAVAAAVGVNLGVVAKASGSTKSPVTLQRCAAPVPNHAGSTICATLLIINGRSFVGSSVLSNSYAKSLLSMWYSPCPSSRPSGV